MAWVTGYVVGYYWAPGGNEYTRACCNAAWGGPGRVNPLPVPPLGRQPWLGGPARQAAVPKLPGNLLSQSKPPSVCDAKGTVSYRLCQQKALKSKPPTPQAP